MDRWRRGGVLAASTVTRDTRWQSANNLTQVLAALPQIEE